MSPSTGPNDSSHNWARDDMVSPPRRTPAADCLEASVTSLEEGGGAAVGPVHHTPVKSRDIGIDMEAIRLSRQDNPYLQVSGGGGVGVPLGWCGLAVPSVWRRVTLA